MRSPRRFMSWRSRIVVRRRDSLRSVLMRAPPSGAPLAGIVQDAQLFDDAARYAHDARVSNAIRYDALLTRDLAAELHVRLRGARVDAILFDRALLRVALLVRL